MNNKKIRTITWTLSIAGLLTIVMYYIADKNFGINLPFGIALIGLAMIFSAKAEDN